MLSLYNIWAVARYEIKTLFRSWFFRIFAGLTIFILFWINFVFLTIGEVPWNFRALASNIPYYNMLLLNTAQAVIAVFLASDFLKRDKKLDTTEVVYMRSMTNADYVLGKTAGILTVFMLLNFFILFMAFIFNIISSNVPVKGLAYLFYPMLISVPTLIFIFGLVFLLMSLIRNQAVTFIILLGYIGLSLFYLGPRFYHIFDYLAFQLPLVYSDFIGFGNNMEVLSHRLLYLFMGIGFILITIKLLKRLPQSSPMQNISAVLSVIFIAGSVIFGAIYIKHNISAEKFRDEARKINDSFAEENFVTPNKINIDLTHKGSTIECSAKIVFKNNTEDVINQYIFNLNPSLEIGKIVSEEKELKFQRNIHLVTIKPHTVLKPLESDSVIFYYKGRINEEISYLDATEEMIKKQYKVWIYNIDKRTSFITPGYLLLTSESLWYPQSGVTYSPKHPQSFFRNFLAFTLDVKLKSGFTAISQGEGIKRENGVFHFAPETPLPKISLIIGNYNRKSITVDSTDYHLYTLPGHDYYQPFLDQIADTLDDVIRERKQDFENRLGLTYGYPEFSLVEVPVQFIAYKRLRTKAVETVQPEMVFLPEKGMGVDGCDFSRASRWEQRRRDRGNQEMTDIEMQTRLFIRFVRSTLVEEESRRRFGSDEQPTFQVSHSIYPNYYSYLNYLSSEKWPMLNCALESYIASRMDEGTSPMRRMFSGVTDDEKVNLALAENNMDQLLRDPEKRDLALNLISLKGDYIFSLMQNEIGDDAFSEDLNSILEDFRFRELTAEDFIDYFKQKYGFDFEDEIERWQKGTDLPGFLITNVEGYSILDGDRKRYQIKFILINREDSPGLVKATFRLGGRGRRGDMMRGRGGDDSDIKKLIKMESRQSKEIGVVLDGQPRAMELNTMISQNLPSTLNKMFEDFELQDKAQPFEGERVLEKLPPLREPGVIIIDNEEEGCEIINKSTQSPLKKWLGINNEPEEKYSGIRFWRPPGKWTPTTMSSFYGDYIKSALYIKAGNGEKKVLWKTIMSERGNYDLYCYYSDIRPPWRRRRESEAKGKYTYIVHHADGKDETLFSLKNAEEGWNFLGTYYLAADTAIVELTDKGSNGDDYILADAIKWVKQ